MITEVILVHSNCGLEILMLLLSQYLHSNLYILKPHIFLLTAVEVVWKGFIEIYCAAISVQSRFSESIQAILVSLNL